MQRMMSSQSFHDTNKVQNVFKGNNLHLSTSSALISPRTDANKPENWALRKHTRIHISNNHVSVSW